MPSANWYFDFISPFAYLQFGRFAELPGDVNVTLKPVLFAGLLKHWGQLGPAEIPPKRTFVYRFFKWHADQRGLPFVMPPSHPFNPLAILRLAVAAGSDYESIRTIFDHVYGQGLQPDDPANVARIAATLGIDDAQTRLAAPEVKQALRENTEEAIGHGAFGVPTFVIDGQLFWGDDATDMVIDYLRNPALFDGEEMTRLSSMPMGVTR